MDRGAWWAAVHGVAKSRTQLSGFTFTFHFCALEKEMATHSSGLAWRIQGMGEPGGRPFMGSQSRTRLKRLSSSRHSFQNTWSMKDTAIKHCIISLIHSGNSHDIYFRDNLLTWTKILLVSQDSVHYPCFAVSTKTKL